MNGKLFLILRKAIPIAKWALGISALVWLSAGFYGMSIGQYAMAALFLVWAAAYGAFWAAFDRRRLFALGFGIFATWIYLEIADVIADSWGHNPPLLLSISELVSSALFMLFTCALAAHVRES